ncbi:LOW QUALITY PROTEIN: FRAS1-related extracellular matrix protein 1b [Limanda limanda]|uniref:LOW QUALITY PROTEIN: FRAS1-related extracellular matrix protein 1b n=1 Tax=Limanda limanda TaxID=27771 RepID=UPI0029C6A7CA|nr:LOW QUALITY PROTEIN: FRAS1-related extracellular matrix protein 1b [Limanda limanda]
MAALGVLLLLAAASAVCSGSLVVVNSGVEVARGRSVSVTEKELKIGVDPGADCKVEVVMNEAVSQRVGRLTPQVFDCSFLEDEVRYVHNGSPLLDEDTVMLRVFRFTSSDTLVETLVLLVRVLDSGSALVELGLVPLVVPQFFALSNAIDGAVLSIRTRGDLLCSVRLTTSDSSVPALGQLVREEDAALRKGREAAALCPGNKPCRHDTKEVLFLKTSCQDFLSSGLKYQHLSPPSPEIDYISIRVELREKSTRALLESEALWLPVLIHGAMQNAFMASFILEVDQFILTPLTTAALDASDHETPQERLVFNVTAPPAEGYVTHLDDHTRPVGSFTWQDLHQMKVAYQPPNAANHSSQSQRRNYEVEFQVIDGSYMTSPPIVVHISIRVAETNAPRCDAAHEGLPVDSFLQRDVLQGHVFYRHSGEELFEDAFDLTLSDSHTPPNLSQTYTVVVHVFPVKDQLPVEAPGAVRSLTVKETEVVHVTQAQLHFTDREHPTSDLSYSVTQPCFSPMHPGLMDAGRLFHTDTANAMRRDHMVPVLKSFTQHAVNHMKVAFMPPVEDIGPAPLFVQFVFSVSDHQGGSVSGVLFNITVTPVDDQAPEAFTNLLRVEEGGEAFLTEEHLLVRDRDSSEDALRAELQRPARHGRLELQGRTLLPGDQFTLQDLRGLRLRFVHDDSETTQDELSLKVTDGLNWAELVLPIQVLPMNDEPPQLGGGLRGELRCEEGGRVQVTLDFLSATDRDSEDARLTYMLARTPRRGELQRAGQTVDRFSQTDVLQGHVYYVHTGGEVGPERVLDTVTLIISDGEAGGTDGCCHGDAPPPPVPLHGTLPVYDLNITVLPVNNQVPAITLGESLLVVDEGSSACLCGGVLGASDPDSPGDQLTFHLETPPLHGFLENTLPTAGSEKSNAGVRVESFSLVHLTSGFINYVQSEHKGAEPTVDQLSISVSDGLHRSAHVPFYIIINPTNDETPALLLANFTVTEGGIRELTPSILNGLDLDAPLDLLSFTVVQPPVHGRLINGIYGAELSRYKEMGGDLLQRSLPVTSFTLQELRQGMKIMYMHDDTETLEDAVALQLTDGVHTVRGTAQVTVLPLNDEKPRLLKNAGLEVDSGERRVISSVALEAEDMDTPPNQVYFFINTAPRFGTLQLKTESSWTELSAAQNFTQLDVELNRLWYRHNANAAGFKGHDSFRFTLSDLENEAPAQSFFISVQTVHKGDIVLQSKAVTLREGQRVVLNTDILLASDTAARPEELVYTVSLPPRRGLVHAVRRPGVPLTSFTQLDVAAHRVCYTHDNSHDGESDSFSFVVSNGVMSRSGSLHLSIQHGDRIPPTLRHNLGLRLQDGATEVIPPELLQLTDPDTPPANLSYIVTQPPRYGRLLLRGAPLTPPLRFTQTDVDRRDLSYRHAPGSPAQTDRFHFLSSDRFHFLSTDGNNRGYLESGQLREEPAVFNIQVDQVDRTPPSLTSRRSPSTVVDLGAGRFGIFITSRHLQAWDPDSPPEELEFSISRPPHFGFLENFLTGGYIRGRFTQRDVDQRAVVFVLPADVEVTADSFEFRLTDPAGNTMLPDVLELFWSRVDLSATCYRTCETSGTLQIQITRSGRSLDPAYVAIQVEEGSAKLGTDFTHSSASLIQFDAGVSVKTWNIYLMDDGLEENHETFSVVLKNPKNAVLGQRSSASVEVIDPRGGRCEPEELVVDEGGKAPPPRLPDPPTPEEDEDPVTDIEAELMWENQPHPPRGDVPDRRPSLDYGEREPQDQPAPGHAPPHSRRLPGTGAAASEVGREGVKFHSLTPLRLEELKPDDSGWSWSHSRPLQEGRVGDTPQMDHPAPELRQHKVHKSFSSWCPDGWTHYRRRCYIISSSVATWASAERSCSLRFNSSLTSVRSRRDMSWLWRFSRKQPFWIGLSPGPRGWTWADGSSVSFSRLRGALPSRTRDDCVLVENPGSWISSSCSAETQHAFICSSPALRH